MSMSMNNYYEIPKHLKPTNTTVAAVAYVPTSAANHPDPGRPPVTVGFEANLLRSVSQRRKRLDMRLSSDPDTRRFGAGTTFTGCGRGLRVQLHVTSRRTFPSAGRAYLYYSKLGIRHLLFPDELLSRALGRD